MKSSELAVVRSGVTCKAIYMHNRPGEPILAAQESETHEKDPEDKLALKQKTVLPARSQDTKKT